MGYKSRERALEYYRQYNATRRPKKQTKPHARTVAIEQGLDHYFTGVPCARGHLAPRRTKDRICMECTREDKRCLNKEKPKWFQKLKKQSYLRNQQHILQQKKQYRQTNKGKIIALATARKKRIKQRTPKWLTPDDKWIIKEVYELAALRTKLFGFSWHVDHIIPLQGKTVTGLHVPTNLQVIPWIDNVRKKNKVLDHGWV